MMEEVDTGSNASTLPSPLPTANDVRGASTQPSPLATANDTVKGATFNDLSPRRGGGFSPRRAALGESPRARCRGLEGHFGRGLDVPSEGGSPTDRFCVGRGISRRESFQIASVKEVAEAAQEWRGLAAQIFACAYLVVVLIFFVGSTPVVEFLLSGSRCWLWLLEMGYFAYAFYLDLLAHYVGEKRFVSFVARSFCTLLGESVFILQLISVCHYWLVKYPADIDGRTSFAYEIHPHGGGLLLLVVEYLCRNFGFSASDYRLVGGALGAYGAIIVPLTLASSTAMSSLRLVHITGFLIAVCCLSTLAVTHKALVAFENPVHIYNNIRTCLGMVHMIFTGRDQEDETPAERGNIPRRMSLKKSMTSVGLELLDPLSRNSQILRAMGSMSMEGRVSFGAIELEGTPKTSPLPTVAVTAPGS